MTDFVSVAWAAKELKVDRRSILYYIESGDLEGARIKDRGWWRVSRESVQRKLEKLEKLEIALDRSER